MIGEDIDAASAGLRVDYKVSSYFSRDYKKLLGAAAQYHQAAQQPCSLEKEQAKARDFVWRLASFEQMLSPAAK